MRQFRVIYALCAMLIVTSCIDKGNYWRNDSPIAKVAGSSLYLSEVTSAVPRGMAAADSVEFAKRYIETWARREVKLQEAERLLKSSSNDIDDIVDAFRRRLLLSKLDQMQLDGSAAVLVSKGEVSEYYRKNISEFTADRPYARWNLLRVDLDYAEIKSIRALFNSKWDTDRKDLRAICEKNGFFYDEGASTWREFRELLDMLPLINSTEYRNVLTRRGEQFLTDGKYRYYFVIDSYCDVGSSTPFELVDRKIESILLKSKENDVIREYEESLYRQALMNGELVFPSKKNIL